MEDFEWSVIHEGQLLDAMVGHKPVGINKYFQMAFICDKFTDTLQKDINSDKIWHHLSTMYNLEALDDSETIPFPNSEKEFVLPELDFAFLIAKKEEDKKPQSSKGRETPKTMKELKKDEKTPGKNTKEAPRRDSKDSKDGKTPTVKKEVKKEPEKPKGKGKNTGTPRGDSNGKGKSEDTPKPVKRPTRGSLKPDDSSSSGKSSPITVTPTTVKRRRI